MYISSKHYILSLLVICVSYKSLVFIFFFFNDTATTEIYTLSLHDALPIYSGPVCVDGRTPLKTHAIDFFRGRDSRIYVRKDRKSTRLNSSHSQISYAVFCLKKKKKITHFDSAFNTHTTLRP